MEWMNSIDDEIEVDIGYIPLLRWKSTRSSMPAVLGTEDLRTVHLQSIDEDLSSLKWTEEISLKEAKESMEQMFFTFKKVCIHFSNHLLIIFCLQVSYYNLTEALPLAKDLHRPVHGIFLWGALDDQSC
jgi:hypothetical protein